jgi:hypothetical protein
MLRSLLIYIAIGFLALVALAVVMGIIGGLIGIALFLVFKVLPLAIIGYLVWRLLRPRQRPLTPEDEEWLET